MNTTTALGLLGLLLLATVPGASANTTRTDTPVCTGPAGPSDPPGTAVGAWDGSSGQDPALGVKVWAGPNGLYVGICGHS